jgi:hypothetical protein
LAELDLLRLNKNIPDFQERLRAPQIKTSYGLYIYREEIINLTMGTKKKKAITESKYKKVNRKSYKNLDWLNRMYDRKTKSVDHIDDDDKDRIYKVILPLEIPKGYKLYDQKGNYYATVMEIDELFYFVAILKNTKEVFPFLQTFVEKMFIQAQCGGKYGFTVPLEFVKDYQRLG